MRAGNVSQYFVHWLLTCTCGVDVPERRILVHRKSRNGKSYMPTGCASVYVSSDADLRELLSMNQRIFCGIKGLYIAESSEKMLALLRSNQFVGDGGCVGGSASGKHCHQRGPTHAMVIEVARSTPQGSHSNTPRGSFSGVSSSSFSDRALSFISGTSGDYTSSSFPSGSPTTKTISFQQHGDVAFRCYEGADQGRIAAQHHLLPPFMMTRPVYAFVGGLCFEATAEYVVWMLDVIGVRLHPQNVMLYQDAKTGAGKGCAQIVLEEADFLVAQTRAKCMLSDASGVFIGETAESIAALLASREFSGGGSSRRGPAHSLVIERRKKPLPAAPTPIPVPVPVVAFPAVSCCVPVPVAFPGMVMMPALSIPANSKSPSQQQQQQALPGGFPPAPSWKK
jgi:hypothetical protein